MLRALFDKHICDKGWRHGYERLYEPLFGPLRQEPLHILEVGVYKGASLSVWAEFFPNAEITGLDTFQRIAPSEVEILNHPRVQYIEGDSRTVELPRRYDIIIDDGAHDFVSQRKTLDNLIDHADLYMIEDVWPLDRMNAKDRKHEWLKRPGFSASSYYALTRALAKHDYVVHDLRARHQPDSCIIEVRP